MKWIVLVGVLLALIGQYHYGQHQERKRLLLSDYQSPDCHPFGVIPGPEDLTLSPSHGLIFISSHNRRDMFNALGSLYLMDPKTMEIDELNITYPPLFRPHGVAIAENCGGSTDVVHLFVISHRFTSPRPHAIEKFSFTVSTRTLKHLQTIEDDLLVSPNDLLALNCDEFLVSNDHYTANILAGLVNDLFKIRSADLLHFDGLSWRNLHQPVAFGNGLITRHDKLTNKEYLYRSSSADYSLFTYEIHRSESGRFQSLSDPVTIETLPFSPDNIEEDAKTGDLIITGHPSTTLFLLHAIARRPAPSVAILYHSPGNYRTLYYDDGEELSAASVATRVDQTLFLGQVFNPFILVCSLK